MSNVNVKTENLVKELTREGFIEQLKSFAEKDVFVYYTGAVSNINSFENFGFYTYSNDETFEDFIKLGSANEEDYNLTICLDCVESYQQDMIAGDLLLVLDNGMLVQIFIENDDL